MRYLIHLLATGFLLLSLPALAQPPKVERAQLVRDFIAAFNAHDTNAMAKFVAEDVQWLSINASNISIETNGKAALVAGMNDYFKSCATCQSRLAEVIATRDRVSAVEVASWRGKDGPKTQTAVSVYEFAGDLIQRVYYFPAEK